MRIRELLSDVVIARVTTDMKNFVGCVSYGVDRDDVTQQAWVKVLSSNPELRNERGLEPVAALSRYMLTVVRHVVLDRTRRAESKCECVPVDTVQVGVGSVEVCECERAMMIERVKREARDMGLDWGVLVMEGHASVDSTSTAKVKKHRQVMRLRERLVRKGVVR